MLDEGGVVSEVSDLSAPENRFERRFGELLEVYTRIETPDGNPACCSRPISAPASIADRRRELASTFVPVLVVDPDGAHAADGADRLDPRTTGARGSARARATDAARDRERRTANVVGSRATCTTGRCRSSPGSRCGSRPPPSRSTTTRLRRCCAIPPRRSAAACGPCAPRSSASTRPTCSRSGLAESLSDLVARLSAQGIEASVEIDPATAFGPDVDALLYRACQEAVRNVEEHADARSVQVSVRSEGTIATLEVGRRRRWHRARARRAGEAGGTHGPVDPRGSRGRRRRTSSLVRPGKPAGTVVRVEVPI